jgi:molybdopterin converting factor small subunit
MTTGVLRYWAAAKEAAGVAEEPYSGHTLQEVIDAAAARHGPELAAVLDRCSYLVDGQQHAADVTLRPDAVIDALPPFAGG